MQASSSSQLAGRKDMIDFHLYFFEIIVYGLSNILKKMWSQKQSCRMRKTRIDKA
jgi:hypothetical protein